MKVNKTAILSLGIGIVLGYLLFPNKPCPEVDMSVFADSAEYYRQKELQLQAIYDTILVPKVEYRLKMVERKRNELKHLEDRANESHEKIDSLNAADIVGFFTKLDTNSSSGGRHPILFQ